MFKLSELKRALRRLGEVEQSRAERWPATGLTALYGLQSPSTPARIRDISASGIYLFTEDRFPIGDLLTVTLLKQGELASSSDLQFSLQARVSAHGEDGIALAFVLPAGVHADLWEVLLRNLVTLTDPVQVEETFRSIRITLFLCRLAQAEAEQAILLLGGELDAERTAALFGIALAAERELDSKPDGDRMRAHPKLLANILREGSWAPDELTRQLWAGLLAASCSADTPDDANQPLVELLVHVTPVEAKIFVLACQRALASTPGSENAPSGRVMVSPEEMVELTGFHDLSRAGTDVAYLFNLGLIEKVFDFTSYHELVSFDVTPSSLGLELYKRCHGYRGKLDPHLVEVAQAHLANFIEQPHLIDVPGPPPPPSTSGS
jgi:hypothetical protein